MNEIEMLRLVRERYTELYWQGCVREYMSTGYDSGLKLEKVVSDGSGGYIWNDIDYLNDSRSCWRASEHYNRLLRLLCQDGKARLESDAELREKAVGLLRHWVKNDYTNPNWWHNDIGTPNHMTALAMMLYDILPKDIFDGVVAIGARGSIKNSPKILKWTGANLIWGVGNTVRHALLTEDTELLAAASLRAQQEITVGGPEGIQPDGGFYQHGPRWYSGGYGANFTFDIAQFAYIFAGTPWAIPSDRMEILLTHVLDGQRHMMHHGFFDYNGVGRELTRRTTLKALIIHYGVELLSRIEDIPRRDEIIEFVKQNDGGVTLKGDVPNALTKYYPSISYLSHNSKGVHIGIKCHAPKQYDMEVCNSEGYLCYNMSYGTRTCHMSRGDEYLDINAIFDYAHLPGTTARLETDEQLKTHVDWWQLGLPNDRTVGLTDGDCGIVSEHPEHDGISLKASYFTFGGKMIALGADIKDEHPERGALTVTVEQCRAFEAQASNGSVASNGDFSYCNLDESAGFFADVVEREGSWQRNSYELPYAKEIGKLFLSYIPVSGNGGKYAYAVCPRGESAGAKILANNGSIQAIITDSGKVMAVFHEDAELDANGIKLFGKAGECVIK